MLTFVPTTNFGNKCCQTFSKFSWWEVKLEIFSWTTFDLFGMNLAVIYRVAPKLNFLHKLWVLWVSIFITHIFILIVTYETKMVCLSIPKPSCRGIVAVALRTANLGLYRRKQSVCLRNNRLPLYNKFIPILMNDQKKSIHIHLPFSTAIPTNYCLIYWTYTSRPSQPTSQHPLHQP